MKTGLVLDALEQALWVQQRDGARDLAGLIHHHQGSGRAKVGAWIEDYDTRRRHSARGMMSPAGYEQALKTGRAA